MQGAGDGRRLGPSHGGAGQRPPRRVPGSRALGLLLSLLASGCAAHASQGPGASDVSQLGDGPPVGVGDPAPAFSLANLNGDGEVTTTKGDVVVVEFWASWCTPCLKQFPELETLYAKYHARGLTIAAVGLDEERAAIPRFLQTYKVSFPVGWDDRMAVSKRYLPSRMPTTFVIDRAGVVRHVHGGYHADQAAEIDAEVAALLSLASTP